MPVARARRTRCRIAAASRVRVAPTLAGGLGGVRDWMRRYPYTCLEQRVSRAVALGDDEAWIEIVTRACPRTRTATGCSSTSRRMRAGQRGADRLRAVARGHAPAAPLPGDVRDGHAGRRSPASSTARLDASSRMADLPLRKLAALEALSRHGKATRGAARHARRRAGALADVGAARLVERAAPRARCSRPGARGWREAEQQVRARLDLSGTTLRFSTASQDDLWWLMTGSGGERGATRAAAPRCRRLARRPAAAGARRARAPARGALGHDDRQRLGHARGRALRRRVRGQAPVTGTTTAALGGQREAVSWAKDPGGRDARPGLAGGGPPNLTVEQAGTGAPWVTVESRAAIPLREPLASGYRVTQAHRAARGRGARHVASRRPPARAARDRGAERHELGRRRRSGARRALAPRHRARRRQRDGGRHRPDDA